MYILNLEYFIGRVMTLILIRNLRQTDLRFTEIRVIKII